MKNAILLISIVMILFSCKQKENRDFNTEASISTINISPPESISVDNLGKLKTTPSEKVKKRNNTLIIPSCDDIFEIFDTYKTDRQKELVGNILKDAALKKVIEGLFGKLFGTFVKLGNPTTANPHQFISFKKSVYDYFTEMKKDNPDMKKARKYIESMKIHALGSRIEIDFGSESKCYDKMEFGIKLLEDDFNNLEKLINAKN